MPVSQLHILAFSCIFALALPALASWLVAEEGLPKAAEPKREWACAIIPDSSPDKTQPPITVTGSVFLDRDGNGRQDAADKGLADVCVSDGLQVVKTGADGSFTLKGVKPGVNRFIFVTTPTGYRIGGAFFKAVPIPGSDFSTGFALAEDPKSKEANHSFAHVTDVHIIGAGSKCFENMKDLPLAFIAASGDLINDAFKPEQFDGLKDALSRSPFPVMCIPGNHDLLDHGDGEPAKIPGKGYADLIGVKYYSFDYGTRHYVMLDSAEDMEMQTAWLKNDLAMQPKEREILIFQHFPPTSSKFVNFQARPEIELYQQYNVKAVFCGHKHSDRVFRIGNMLYVQTPTLNGIGLDYNPATIRVVTFKDGEISIANIAPGYGDMDKLPAQSEAKPSPAATPVELGAEWSSFKGNAQRSGAAKDGPQPPLAIAWKQQLGGSIHFSSPVVGGGMLYIGTGDSENFGRAGVYALDAKTGAIAWKYPTNIKVAHTVCLENGAVYAASNDGVVHALDAKTGSKRWNFALGDPLEYWMYASPLASGKQVFAGIGLNFVALDADTGKQLWQLPNTSAGWWPTYSSPAIAKGKLVAAYPGPGLFAADASTGKIIWEAGQSIPVNPAATIAIKNDLALVHGGGTLCAVGLADGKERWRYASKGGVSSPVVCGDAVYLAMGGKVAKLDATSGKELWLTKDLRAGKQKFYFSAFLMGTPVVTEKLVYLATTDGQLLMLDTATGAAAGTVELGTPLTASPAISGNTVYVASYTGTVFALTPEKK